MIRIQELESGMAFPPFSDYQDVFHLHFLRLCQLYCTNLGTTTGAITLFGKGDLSVL